MGMANTKSPNTPQQKYVFPISLLSEDRELLDSVRANYSGLSKHMLLRAALRKALSDDLSDPGSLVPYLTTVRSKVVDQPTTLGSGEVVDQLPTSPSTPGNSDLADELEDFGPDCDFAVNPFI